MRKLKEEILFDGKWRSIVGKTFDIRNRKTHVFEIISSKGATAVLICALDKAGKFVMIQQFRAGPEKSFIEVPAGVIEGGENITDGIKRELIEETGYTVGSIECLGEFNPDPYADTHCYCFLALDCEKKAEQSLEDTEEIEVMLMSQTEVLQALKNGNILLAQAGVLLLALERLGRIK